jgi:hypothetical protein
MLQGLRVFEDTTEGRTQAIERTEVEHAHASICNRKDHRASYIVMRQNEYHLNRAAAITNPYTGMALAA